MTKDKLSIWCRKALGREDNQNTVVHFDFDGTLAEWKDLIPEVKEMLIKQGESLSSIEDVMDTPERLNKEIYKILDRPGYYYDLVPYDNVVGLAKNLFLSGYDTRVLTCVISENAMDDKNFWIEDFCPLIFGGTRKHDGDIARDDRLYTGKKRIFVPDKDKENKFAYIPDIEHSGLTHILIDDHTPNLFAFEKACKEHKVNGIGIKMLNGVNGHGGRWEGYTLDKDSSPREMAEKVKGIAAFSRMEYYMDRFPGIEEEKTEVTDFLKKEMYDPKANDIRDFIDHIREEYGLIEEKDNEEKENPDIEEER